MAGYIEVSIRPAITSCCTRTDAQDEVYGRLLGEQSPLTGLSLQNSYAAGHERTLRVGQCVSQAGRPWVVAGDEQGSSSLGVPPDPGYKGFSGKGPQGNAIQTIHDIRKWTLWGNLMAGGAGVEHTSDINYPKTISWPRTFAAEKSWDYGRIALEFFRTHKIPFWEMTNANAVGNTSNDNSRYVSRARASCTGLSAVWRHRRSRSEPGRRPVPRELVRSPERGKAHARVGAVGCRRCLEIGRAPSERP